MKKVNIAVSFIIILLLIYFLVRFNALSNLNQIVRHFKSKFLIPSVLLYVLAYFFRAKRFNTMIKGISTRDMFAVMCVHTFFNNVMPFRSGEASFPIILKKIFSIDTPTSTASLVMARILDLITVSLLFLLSTTSCMSVKTAFYAIPIATIVILIGISFVVFRIIKKNEAKFKNLSSFIKTLGSIDVILKSSVYSMLIWLSKFAAFYMILTAGNLRFGFLKAIFACTFGELTTVLPIHSIGGFGTFEAGLTGGFALIGIDASKALAVAFYFHIILLSMSGTLALTGWLYLSRLRT